MTTKTIKIIWILLLILVNTGCARNISGKLDSLLRFQLNITFKNPPNPNQYNYYVFFSTSTNPKVPETLPLEYFFTPGRNYDPVQLIPTQDDISRYYQSFFSTWSDYLVIDSTSSAALYNSNATNFDSETSDNADYDFQVGFKPDRIEIDGNILRIQFTLQLLSDNLETNETLYYTIATSEKDATFQESGTLIDIILNNDPSVTVPSEPGTFNDTDRSETTHSAADIVSWEARIF